MSGSAGRLALLLVLVASGCASWPPDRSVDDAQLERWVSEQRYGPVLDVLARRAASGDADAHQRLEDLRTQAAHYDRTAGDAIQRLTEAGRWEEAEAALIEAQERFPDGQHIRHASLKLAEARRARAERLEADLLLARVAWLKQSQPLWQELAALDASDLEASWHVHDTARQLKNSGERLGQLGLNALSRSDYERAEQLLGAALPLAPNDEFARALTQIAEQQSKVREAKQGRARQREELLRQQTVETLAARVEDALGSGRLSRAQGLLAELQSLDGGGDIAGPLQRKLRQA
ncbi:MAG TPA: hypothetical protein ENO23_04020, partial [Alphaproteobacteria bacterium]|nr:hypothetical protein [Alphaproteobacteria bacterium]